MSTSGGRSVGIVRSRTKGHGVLYSDGSVLQVHCSYVCIYAFVGQVGSIEFEIK
jgi:hypothetical protein